MGLGAGLVGMGALHFVVPDFFERMVPDYIPGDPDLVHRAAGAAEIVSGSLLLLRRTSRLGGLAAFATLSGVYIANIQEALDGSIGGAKGQVASVGGWLRLPLQFPLLYLAYQVARPEPAPVVLDRQAAHT